MVSLEMTISKAIAITSPEVLKDKTVLMNLIEDLSPVSSIEVYYKGNRICSHKRLYGRRGQYSTIPEHMPVNHQLYSEWDKARFLKWASGIGGATHQVIQGIFDSYRIEEQAYKMEKSLYGI